MGNYYGAYLFDSDSNRLEKLLWDNSEIAIGLLDDSKCKAGSIVIRNRSLEHEEGCQTFYQ